MSPSTVSYIRMVFVFCNTVLGLSALAMPYCFYQCGVLLGLITFGVVTYLSYVSCKLLVRTAHDCGVRRFEQLAFLAFGRQGKLMVEVCSVVTMIGYLVALLILGGNLVPEFLDEFLDLNTESRVRELVILCLGAFVILPVAFCWSRRLLRVTSLLTLVLFIMLLLVMFVLSQTTVTQTEAAVDESDYESADETKQAEEVRDVLSQSSRSIFSELRLWNLSGLLVALPILANSVTCQAQLLVVCDAFRNELTPNVFRRVIVTTMSITFSLYCAIGVLGYAAFRNAPTIHGDVFLNFSVAPHSNTFITRVFRVLFVTVNLISSPICIAPCRSAIHSLMQTPSPENEVNESSSDKAGPRISLKPERILASTSDRRVVLVDFGTVQAQIDGQPIESGASDDASMTRGQFVNITVGIVSVSVCIAVLVPTVEFLFALLGGIFAASLCYATPAAIYKRLALNSTELLSNGNVNLNLNVNAGSLNGRRRMRAAHADVANVLIVFAAVVMLLTMLGTLAASPKSAPLENVVDALHAERLQNEMQLAREHKHAVDHHQSDSQQLAQHVLPTLGRSHQADNQHRVQRHKKLASLKRQPLVGDNNNRPVELPPEPHSFDKLH